MAGIGTVRSRRMRLLVLGGMVIGSTRAEQQRQVLARAEYSLGVADWQEGGSCGDAIEGCRREAISARATVLGQPFDADDCGVVDRSAGDGFTMDDVTDGFTFGVLHTCESEGEVLPQVWRQSAGACVWFGREPRLLSRGPLQQYIFDFCSSIMCTEIQQP